MLFSPYVSHHGGEVVKTGREVDTNTREAFGLEMWYTLHRLLFILFFEEQAVDIWRLCC